MYAPWAGNNVDVSISQIWRNACVCLLLQEARCTKALRRYMGFWEVESVIQSHQCRKDVHLWNALRSAQVGQQELHLLLPYHPTTTMAKQVKHTRIIREIREMRTKLFPPCPTSISQLQIWVSFMSLLSISLCYFVRLHLAQPNIFPLRISHKVNFHSLWNLLSLLFRIRVALPNLLLLLP